MNYKKVQAGFFLSLFGLVVILSVAVFLPYIYSIIFAFILAVVFHPVYKLLLRLSFFQRFRGLASFLIVLLILFIILLPLITIGLVLIKEASSLYSSLVQDEFSYKLLEKIEISINTLMPQFASYDLTANFDSLAKDTLNFVIKNLGLIFSNVLSIVFGFFMTLFAMYYILKDSPKIKNQLILLSPLSDKYDKRITAKLMLAVNSVIKGTLLVALIQGVLAGLGFWIFGVPNPVLLGAITVIAALIPAVGTASIMIPTIVYIFATGHFLPAIGLTVWAFLLVGMIDNILRPKLIEKDIKIHPLLIFISALGGLAIFGAPGFIIGPLIMALLYAMIDIYKEEFQNYLRNSR
ncbi:TPA: hypothetical protein DF272_03130 [Candidatus Falkowbacteria bacterium]|nr:hypothetical protein [Candidatus Falkowbacteria bacterium]